MHFIAKNKVRMHDTDMAGILYFARQFRFAHDALEDFMEAQGWNFKKLFTQEKFVFVIVHCEADYFAPLDVGDRLEVHLSVEHIGNTSFSLLYKIFRDDGTLIGSCKTVHVSLHHDTRKKTPIPANFRKGLEKYLTDA